MPHRGKSEDSSTYRTQDFRSTSVESNGTKSVRFQTNSTWNAKKQYNKQTRGRLPEPGKANKNNRNTEPCKHCKRNNHDSRDIKACFKCGRVGFFKKNGKTIKTINQTKIVYTDSSKLKQWNKLWPTTATVTCSCGSTKPLSQNWSFWRHHWMFVWQWW